jgi:hypothetical protein
MNGAADAASRLKEISVLKVGAVAGVTRSADDGSTNPSGFRAAVSTGASELASARVSAKPRG